MSARREERRVSRRTSTARVGCARTVRDLEGVRGDDAAAAEGARGEALDAGLKVGHRRRAALFVPANDERIRGQRRPPARRCARGLRERAAHEIFSSGASDM